MRIQVYTVLFLLLFINTLLAQVHINEYSASNLNSFLDNFQKTEDWIELYNNSSAAVDISGWHLSDKESKPEKWEIPAGTVIPANGFLVFLCSGRDGFLNGQYHTNFKLSQTKTNEVVLLSDATANVIDMFPLGLTLVEHSHCRQSDGSATWRICTAPSFGTTNNGTPQFTAYTATPHMSLNAGFYSGAQVVALTNNEPNSTLHYTLDGTNPTQSSPIYTGSLLTVTNTQVVKARSFSNDPLVLPGKMDFRTFFINEPNYSLAVFSVAADDVIDLANGNGSLIPIGSLEYFNTADTLEATSFGSLNRHGQDSWVLPHRSLDWVSRDEMGYSRAVQSQLFSFSDRDSYQKFMFRNSGDDNYPAINDAAHQGSTHIRDEYVQELAREDGMKLDTRAVERVIVFLNGQYWGVYGMRDRPVDHDYTDEYYDQGKYDIQYLTTWGDTEIEYGGLQAIQDWESIRDFVLNNDMSDANNYELVEDSINLTSLIDYMLVNLNVVASDWLNYNTGWWRGLDPDGDHKKWGYILWDLDATFDYYINYSGVPNISPEADPCDLEEIGEYMDEFFGFYGNVDVGQHEKIFLKLLDENPVFKQLYYSRYTDMMNTVYTCENMTAKLDEMLAVIEPEMPGQIARWGGTMTEWQANVQRLKDFVDERCLLLDDGMLECYPELTGPYPLTLLTQPDAVGEIDLNTLDIEVFPWTGDYFGGMENKIKAKAFDEDAYQFSHWISTAGNVISPDVNTRKATISLASPDTLIAVFEPCAGVELDISFDGFPGQTSWEIIDEEGEVVASGDGDGLSANDNIIENSCLFDGCYTLNFYDSVGNGMCPFQSTASSSGTFIVPGTLISYGSIVATLGTVVNPSICGNFSLTDAAGTTLAAGGAGFGAQQSRTFCLTNGIGALVQEEDNIYSRMSSGIILGMEVQPNIVQDNMMVRYNLDTPANAELYIIDINGKVLQQHSQSEHEAQEVRFNVSELPAGFYFVHLVSDQSIMVRKFAKQ